MRNDIVKEIREDLIEFQNSYDVSTLKYKDFELWSVVLFEIFNLIREKKKKKSKSIFVRVFEEFLYFFVRLIQGVLDNKMNSNNNDCEVLFLTQSTRRVKLGNKYFDRIIDPFVLAFNEIGCNTEVIEWTYDKKYKIPRFYYSEFIQNQMGLSLFRKLIFDRKDQNCDLLLLDNSDFSKMLIKLDCSNDSFKRKVLFTSRNIDFLSSFFEKKIIRYSKLKYAFLYPYFGNVSFAFNLACKRKGVKTIEIQHGYYGENGILFNGYANLKKSKLIPNAIWCWEERDANIIKNWGNSCDVPFTYVGGNLYSNFWSNTNCKEQNQLVNSYDNSMLKYPKKEKNILVTLSPYDDVPEWFICYMENEKDYIWFIRFHHHTPKEVKNKILKRMCNVKTIETDLSNSLPLPLLFRMVRVHITVFSSCVADAKDFYVKSIIISELGVSIFKNFIETKWAYPALNSKDIERVMEVVVKENILLKSCSISVCNSSNKEIILDFLEEYNKFSLNLANV